METMHTKLVQQPTFEETVYAVLRKAAASLQPTFEELVGSDRDTLTLHLALSHLYELTLVPVPEQGAWGWVYRKNGVPQSLLQVIREEQAIEAASQLAFDWFVQYVWWSEHMR